MSDSGSFHSRHTLEALRRLEKVILDTLDFHQVVQKICDEVLNELYFLDLSYRVVILALATSDQAALQVVAFSQTPEAEKAMKQLGLPWTQIHLPLSQATSITTKVFREQHIQVTPSWSDVLVPPLTSDSASAAQIAASIQTTILVPIAAKGKSLGVLFFCVAKPAEMVEGAEKELMQGFADTVSVAVENAKLYTTLEDASRKLAAANEQLKQLDRLKDEFVSAAAHALRSPMTAIKGYLSMVLEGDGGAIPDKARDFLTGAYEGNDRLIRLVNHMLDISRIESGRLIFNLTQVQLEDLVQSEVTGLKILAQAKGLSLIYEPPSTPLPKVKVDPDRLREVINNLVGNAIKFTAQGSVIITHTIKDDFLLTHVSDTGPGIAPEDVKHLFQKFTQVRLTSGKTSGSGLGLYVSQIIMKEFGGNITLVSQVSKGSTFTFSIPLKTR